VVPDESQMWKERIVHEHNPRIVETGRRIWKTIDTLPHTAEYDRHTTIKKHSDIRTGDVSRESRGIIHSHWLRRFPEHIEPFDDLHKLFEF
jgi:hypothetical protein